MSYKNNTDEELIEFTNNGNSEALSSLLERHYLTIYKFAYKFSGNQNDAEEIAQEASIKIATKIHMFKGDAKFTTWFYRIVMNTAKDFCRKNSKRGEEELFENLNVKSDDNQEKAIIIKETLELINSLPTRIKETVILVYWEGLTHREVANILGCKETTISWRIHEARKEINSILKGGLAYG